jgi:hypothetical protein
MRIAPLAPRAPVGVRAKHEIADAFLRRRIYERTQQSKR